MEKKVTKEQPDFLLKQRPRGMIIKFLRRMSVGSRQIWQDGIRIQDLTQGRVIHKPKEEKDDSQAQGASRNVCSDYLAVTPWEQ